jgi:hypothetical protein
VKKALEADRIDPTHYETVKGARLGAEIGLLREQMKAKSKKE